MNVTVATLFCFTRFLNWTAEPRNPFISSEPSLNAVSKGVSPSSRPPPKSAQPGVSSNSFSFPNKKYTLPFFIATGNIPPPHYNTIIYFIFYTCKKNIKVHFYETDNMNKKQKKLQVIL